jgi:hypothetical protein
MFFNNIYTIAACWGPLTVKGLRHLRLQNLSGNGQRELGGRHRCLHRDPVGGLPAALAPGASLDVQ